MGLDTPQSKVNAKISAPSFPPRFSRQPALLSVHSHAAPASLHQWAPSSAPHRWCRRWAWEGDGSLQPSLLHSTSVTLTSSLFPPHQFSPSSLCSYRGLSLRGTISTGQTPTSAPSSRGHSATRAACPSKAALNNSNVFYASL